MRLLSKRSPFAIAPAILVPALSGIAAAQVSFRGVGTLAPDQLSGIRALSQDGSVAVGSASSPVIHAMKWTSNGSEILDASPPFYEAYAYDTSADGNIVVGYGRRGGQPGTAFTAFRMVGSEMSHLPGLQANDSTRVSATSADGSVVVGHSGLLPCYWNGAPEPVVLPRPAGTATTFPASISDDGSRILAMTRGSDAQYHMVLWNNGAIERVMDLDVPPGAAFGGVISGDGNSIVGSFASGSTSRGFHWTEAGGVEELPSSVVALTCSADGSVIGGRAPDQAAAIWINGEFVNVSDLLTSQGIDLSDWDLYEVTSISADGRTIAGAGHHWYTGSPADRRTEAWIAVIPGPSAGVMFVAGVLAARRRRG
jgi:uncharacterized membrane protein